ncbi:hypothetical protein J4467_01065 [Candidatus Woesearchaeota archaeon]|nr:hypothetical protein [Candidatus Woesearchaeota archaeon]
MIHEKTGYYCYLVCTKCKKKTKHWEWSHETAYVKKSFFGLIKKMDYKFINGYECSICHRSFNFQGKVKLFKKN